MNKNFIRCICFLLLVIFTPITVYAQDKFDTLPSTYFYIFSASCGNDTTTGFNNGTISTGFWNQPGTKSQFVSGDKITIDKNYKMNGGSQWYTFQSAGGGWYYILCQNGGYLDVTGGVNADGVRMQVYAFNGSASQKFRLVHQGDGRFKIYTAWGRVLSIVGQNKNVGTEINTWVDHASAAAEWYLLDVVAMQKYPPSPNADFIINCKDNALVYSFNTDSGDVIKGTAYIASISGSTAYTVIEYPQNGKLVSDVIKVQYFKGAYTLTSDRAYTGFLTKYFKTNTIMLKNGTKYILLSDTRKPKSTVYPQNPDFFIQNKNFDYESQGMESRTTGSAVVTKITGNVIELSIAKTGDLTGTGKIESKTVPVKLYYANGGYSFNYPNYNTFGAAGSESQKLEIRGEQSFDTFTVKKK